MRVFFVLTFIVVVLAGCETTNEMSNIEYNRARFPNVPSPGESFDERFRQEVLDNGLGVAVNKAVTPNYGEVECYKTSYEKESDNGMNIGKFDREPSSTEEVSLWATNYYTPLYENGGGNIAIKNMGEKTFVIDGESVSLPEKEWCMAGMEGSAMVKLKSGKTVTFNYAGKGSHQADCAKYFRGRFAATGKVKYKISNSTFGEGVPIPKSKRHKSLKQGSYSLVPFRTIAVDPRKIPYGSVIFIKEAKGTEVTLPDGSKMIHDGYFFAGDTGGGIKGNHIDVFTGDQNTPKQPFNFIKSSARGTFKAKVVRDQEIVDHLTALHTMSH